jgi:hypothetical protein
VSRVATNPLHDLFIITGRGSQFTHAWFGGRPTNCFPPSMEPVADASQCSPRSKTSCLKRASIRGHEEGADQFVHTLAAAPNVRFGQIAPTCCARSQHLKSEGRLRGPVKIEPTFLALQRLEKAPCPPGHLARIRLQGCAVCSIIGRVVVE